MENEKLCLVCEKSCSVLPSKLEGKFYPFLGFFCWKCAFKLLNELWQEVERCTTEKWRIKVIDFILPRSTNLLDIQYHIWVRSPACPDGYAPENITLDWSDEQGSAINIHSLI